jgi:hypothetical protein
MGYEKHKGGGCGGKKDENTKRAKGAKMDQNAKHGRESV